MSNKVLNKVSRGEVTLGAWITISHPEVVEILSNLPFDWFMFDMEHAPLTLKDIEVMLMPLRGSDIVPLVRVPWNDFVVIKQVLDLGIQGVLIPWVNTREEAEKAVNAMKYPPEGIRGVGPRRCIMYGFYDIKNYYDEWNRNFILLVQIETMEALKNVEGIVSVKDVSGTFIGPNDLSASLGIFRDFKNPKYIEAISKVLKVTKSVGKIAGIMALTPDDALEKIKMGFNFIALSHDVRYLIEGAKLFFKTLGIPK